MKRIVYISGPYSSGDQIINVREALIAAEIVYALGRIPYVPHLTHFWHGVFPHDYEFWLEIDLAIIPKFDILLRIPGESKGADREVEVAHKNNVHVIMWSEEKFNELKEKLKKGTL